MQEIIIIPSGRANFAALVEQKPSGEYGINNIQNSGTLELVYQDEFEIKEKNENPIYIFFTNYRG